MTTLRERCEKLCRELVGELFPGDLYVVEAFAREVRDETLEEVAKVTECFKECGDRWECGRCDAAHEIRALKKPVAGEDKFSA